MTSIIHIENLKCDGCINQIISSLQKIEGVAKVSVELKRSMVTIEYLDPIVVDAVKVKLKAIGYPSAGFDNSTLDKVKSYASCAVGRIKNTVN